MNFGEAIKSVFSKYATFSGRARRSEYWYFYLFNLLVSLGVYLITLILPKFGSVLNILVTLGFLLPALAVAVRRLHDIGKSGWYLLIPMIPSIFLIILSVIGLADGSNPSAGLSIAIFVFALAVLAIAIIMLVWFCRDSEPGENKWGPNPKEQPETEPQNLD